MDFAAALDIIETDHAMCMRPAAWKLYAYAWSEDALGTVIIPETAKPEIAQFPTKAIVSQDFHVLTIEEFYTQIHMMVQSRYYATISFQRDYHTGNKLETIIVIGGERRAIPYHKEHEKYLEKYPSGFGQGIGRVFGLSELEVEKFIKYHEELENGSR